MAPKAALKRPAGAEAKSQPPAKLPKAERKAAPTPTPAPTAAAPAPPSAANQRLVAKLGVPLEAYTGVMDGLMKATHLSDSCREMLISMVPVSLCVPVEHRGEQQVLAVGMFEEALGEVAAKLREDIVAAEAAAQAAEAAKGELAEQVHTAEASTAAAQQCVAEKQAAFEEATRAVAEAKKTVAEKEKEYKANGVALDRTAAELGKVESLLANELTLLKERRWEKPAELKKMQTALEGALKKLQVESSLLAALPGVLAKKPEERGSFDGMLLAECEERLKKRIGELQEQSAALTATAAAIAEPLELGRTALEAASSAQSAAADALREAQAAGRDASAALQAAQEALAGSGPAAEGAAAELGARKAELEAFTASSLAGLATLLQFTKVKPVAEEPAAPAEEAMQVEAAEELGSVEEEAEAEAAVEQADVAMTAEQKVEPPPISATCAVVAGA